MKINLKSNHVKEAEKRLADHQEGEKLQEWHFWFAWYPVRLDDNEVRWMENVGRKAIYYYGDFSNWVYRSAT